ncbi:MAG TPA: thiamine pyrophosphate-binding protein [Beijerinckiaceae bacterium]|jgi:acetolactate synthase I/II/III large subunit|nr:thiamine pyrophosphate-binding protein [Beijerinckiaceae bacterium]
MRASNTRTGGQILVDQLVAQGVEHVFCVPGESYLAVLDAFHDANLNVTVCRQEGGATMMADASARLTGRPGIAFVTRGPGATNAMPAIHIAEHDDVPLILFIGQVGREMRERGAFQEMNYRALFGSTTKWATEIDDPARIPEIVSRAFHVAMQGRPGPVVIGLPEDMLTDQAAVEDAARVERIETYPGKPQIEQLQELLSQAKAPVVILGGGGWTPQAVADMRQFAQRFQLPVSTVFRRAMLFDYGHECYIGELGISPNPKLKARIESADLVLIVGDRMAELQSQSYTLFEIPNPRQKLVHVHAAAEELGRVYHPHLGVHATPAAFCAALAELQPPKEIAWADATASHADYIAWTEKPSPSPGSVHIGEIAIYVRDHITADAIITNGAGNFAGWVQRYMRYRSFGTQLAPTSGSMGYGVPAAVGAKRVQPERTVICFAGDGDFLMNGQEFATAVQYDLPIVVVLLDNGMYGTIRMHQERDYPGRISATVLNNPDFAAYARAFGGHGETVERTADFGPAFERAVKSGKPAIIHTKVDPEAITPTTTLTQIREKALAGRK